MPPVVTLPTRYSDLNADLKPGVGSVRVREALWLVIFIGFGCQPTSHSAPASQEAETPLVSEHPILTDRVWVRSDSTGMPGGLLIFLADGTLVFDSCWETYRLAEWTMESDSMVRWQENTMTIRAEVVEADEANLVLRVNLVDGWQEEHYRKAQVPYVCPDMPR